MRARRDGAAVETTLAALKRTAAREQANLMPGLLDAARAHATEGEIIEALQEVFGSYETPVIDRPRSAGFRRRLAAGESALPDGRSSRLSGRPSRD